MSNPEYDMTIIQPHQVDLLREVHEGNTRWRNGIAGLLRRELVMDDGLYAVKVTGRGLFALRGVFEGMVVQVQSTHHLPFLHNAVGLVEGVFVHNVDSDGVDEYGYTVHRARPTTSVMVRLGDRPGQWMFHRPQDLVGFPKLKAEINEYWRFKC